MKDSWFISETKEDFAWITASITRCGDDTDEISSVDNVRRNSLSTLRRYLSYQPPFRHLFLLFFFISTFLFFYFLLFDIFIHISFCHRLRRIVLKYKASPTFSSVLPSEILSFVVTLALAFSIFPSLPSSFSSFFCNRPRIIAILFASPFSSNCIHRGRFVFLLRWGKAHYAGPSSLSSRALEKSCVSSDSFFRHM